MRLSPKALRIVTYLGAIFWVGLLVVVGTAALMSG